MIAADGLIAGSSAVLAVVFLLFEAPPVWFTFLVLFIRGLGNTFHAPAMQAAIPMFVPVEMLQKAGGWGSMVISVSTMLGPALGAGLMAVFPAASVMLVDIIGAVLAILCLLTIRLPDLPSQSCSVRLLDDARQGFRALRDNKPLMAVFLPILLSTILYMPLGSLYPLLIRTYYMGGAWHNAAAEFIFSGGLLLSSLIMGIWGGMNKRFMMISMAITVLGAAALIGGSLPPRAFPLFLVCSMVMGASGTFFNVPLMAYIQETTAPEMMGKVFSLLTAAMTLASPLGLLLAGPVSELIGVHRWFILSGFLMTAAGIYCFLATRPYDRENSAKSQKG